MSCNGKCYQGRWCDCKDEVMQEVDERMYAYAISFVICLFVGVIACLIR